MGLEYAALPAVFEMMEIPRPAWRETFEDLRVMEAEAISAIAKGAK